MFDNDSGQGVCRTQNTQAYSSYSVTLVCESRRFDNVRSHTVIAVFWRC